MESSRAPGKSLSHRDRTCPDTTFTSKVPTESVKGRVSRAQGNLMIASRDHMNQTRIFAMAACAKLITLKPGFFLDP